MSKTILEFVFGNFFLFLNSRTQNLNAQKFLRARGPKVVGLTTGVAYIYVTTEGPQGPTLTLTLTKDHRSQKFFGHPRMSKTLLEFVFGNFFLFLNT